MLLSQPTQSQKLHKTLLNGIAGSLASVFNDNRYSDKVLEKLFKQNKQWGSRDRKFVAESVYDIVRYYRLLSHIAQSKNNYWFITAVYLVLKGIELPPWPEFKHVNNEQIKLDYEKSKSNFCLFQSYPDSIKDICVNELGEEIWQREAEAMNQHAEVVLRVNTIKTNTSSLQEKLKAEGIETNAVEHMPNALLLNKRANVFTTSGFKEGLFELQDAGSQQIGIFSNPQPGQIVIDACAGAGGKSLQLAALMQNKGRIISMDVTQWKLDELAKRTKRAGVQNLETRLIEGSKTIEKFEGKADVVLLDVPCSGLGVLKRNPDTKWKFSVETLKKTTALQAQILNDYSTMVKPGGELIYSTCSILPSENSEQIQNFLKNNNTFVISHEKTIYPSQGFDGFYMCKLKRRN